MPNSPKSLLIVTDAWKPQVNGVVRTIEQTIVELESQGIDVKLLTPAEFRTMPMPGYPEIGLSLTTPGPVIRRIERLRPEAIHIATEGPLGLIARNYCVRTGRPFSTAYHTQFPEYLRARWPVPLSVGYRMIRWFHGPSRAVMVGTVDMQRSLVARGFTNVKLWTKGVDTALFNPDKRAPLPYGGPVFLYVGRVAVEKNIGAFLSLDLPGTKLVVGDGPALQQLRQQYPDVTFLGTRQGSELATLFASADVFVFPSRTDTFGLVLLEALASGTPVAAYPVTGPIDVIGNAPVGVLDGDLRAAALRALTLPREPCRQYADGYSWQASAGQFLSYQTAMEW
ncbi:MAG: glycosyltransferase family 1 protein [Hyphomicrobiales bacterium]|nr:MAG: glycosyltransferase family 1 protein [Hyphomicrobiales bacterium]